MKHKNSYRIDGFAFKNDELSRLEKRTTFRIEQFENTLSSLRLKKGEKILEIGSGTGFRANLLANTFKSAHITAVDISKDMTAYSASKYSSVANLTFLNLDIETFLKKNSGEFSLIYFRLVAQHVGDALKLIRMCHSSLKSGGHLIVEDVDRQLMVFEPSTDEWDAIYMKAIKAHRNKGGDPFIGRKLASYITRAGFNKIANRSYLHHGDSDFFKVWADDFAPSFFNNLSNKDRTKGLSVLKLLKKRSDEVPVSFTQLWFLLVATK